MGVGVNFITSRKFLFGDGGIKRIVWMPKSLKERVGEAFKARAQEEGVADLLDKIADDSICEDSEKLMEHLSKVGHPALEMPPIL
jgi:acetyl-CoA synthase